jgi:hypothetical protein
MFLHLGEGETSLGGGGFGSFVHCRPPAARPLRHNRRDQAQKVAPHPRRACARSHPEAQSDTPAAEDNTMGRHTPITAPPHFCRPPESAVIGWLCSFIPGGMFRGCGGSCGAAQRDLGSTHSRHLYKPTAGTTRRVRDVRQAPNAL